MCGMDYRQGSYLCESCATGAYAVGDGSCAHCPDVITLWDRYSGLLELIIGIGSLSLVLYVVLFLMIRSLGKEVSVIREAKHLITLVTW